MGNSIFATIGRVITTVFILIFLDSCANRDVATKAYESGNYEDSFKILKRWANAGYGSANLKLAQMAQRRYVVRSDKLVIENAKKAYQRGKIRAAFILENIYVKKRRYKKAINWMEKGNFYDSSSKDLDTHLFLIQNYIYNHNTKRIYLEKVVKLAKAGNTQASYKLGKFYQNSHTRFYDLNKSIYFYKMAYNEGDKKSAIELALIYLNGKKTKTEGLKILKSIAKQGSSRASMILGKYLYRQLPDILKRHAKSCISLNFNNPIDFYRRKLKLESIRRLYMKKNIAPWFLNAYKQGDRNGMVQLIRFDILEDNFTKASLTYCGLSLKEAILYLNTLSFVSIKAKLLLADIYIKYPYLHEVKLAEQIYIDYRDINSTDADWKLYQFYKKFYPNKKKSKIYLNHLVAEKFTPAIIEKSYIDILKRKEINPEAYKILTRASRRGNSLALEYIFNLSLKGILDNAANNPCTIGKEICKLKPLDGKIDLKIADCYKNSESDKNLTKAATIYQFYAEKNNSIAQFELANIYKRLGDKKRNIIWLKSAKKLGNTKAKLAYDMMILKGKANGNIDKALNTIKKLAKSGDKKANMLLGDMYAQGDTLPYNPKKSLYYYGKILNMDKKLVFLKMINLYKHLNILHQFDKEILDIYAKLISIGYEDAKIDLAQFLISLDKHDRARKLLMMLQPNRSAKVKYLLYRLTGNERYIYNSLISNNGDILLAYAKNISDNSRKKALLFAFRSALCNTSQSGRVIYNLMRLIDNPNTINAIYSRAKQYPKCYKFK